MTGVKRSEMDDSGSPVPDTDQEMTSETGLYAFVMPGNDVIVEGASVPIPSVANVLYVRGLTEDEIAVLEADPTAIPSGDGSSWENASLDLQDVMDNKWAAGQEIWVSAGRVRPDLPETVPDWWTVVNTYNAYRSDPRNRGFVLKDGVKIYGGFKGTETERIQRNPALYETVLSGDLGEAGRVKRVVIAAGVSIATRLDGLTISGGNYLNDVYSNSGFKINGQPLPPDSTYGGGIYGAGGGLININASPWLHNVTFKDNSARIGAAIFNWNSSPVLTDVTIRNCTATGSGSIYNDGSGSSFLMIGGSVRDNAGDGVYAVNGSSILINVTIRGNSNDGVSYMGLFSPGSQKLINVTVTVTGNNGAGIRRNNNSVNLTEAVFNSDIVAISGGSSELPVNSLVDGVMTNPGNAGDYWPVVNNALNTNSYYSSGGALYEVYLRLNGLFYDPNIQAEILPLLTGLPEQGAKQ
jgi:hypothetical protein